MKRYALYAVLVAAAVVPATTGLLANASFSQDVPVRTPPQAQLLVDDGPSSSPLSSAPTTSPSPSGTATRHAEPGDDHGGDRDRTSRTTEPGDDHGGDRDRATEIEDDHGDSSDSGRGSDDDGTDDSGKESGGHGSDD